MAALIGLVFWCALLRGEARPAGGGETAPAPAVVSEELSQGARKLSDYTILKRVRALYRDLDGQRTYGAFLRAHGLTPWDERYQWRIVFKAAYPSDAVQVKEDSPARGLTIARDAKAVYTDVEVIRERTYGAANRALPVWDARLYQEGERVVVGGYSAGLCEKPVAEIDELGRMTENGDSSPSSGGRGGPGEGGAPKMGYSPYFPKERFAVLGLDRERLIFDPFQFRLLMLEPTGGKAVSESASSFLPLQLWLPEGGQAQGTWRIEEWLTGGRRQFALMFKTGDQDVLVASAVADAESLVSAEPGYAPQLSGGCAQAAGPHATILRFQGQFADTVLTSEGRLVLLATVQRSRAAAEPPRPQMALDGLFDDWRNVPGVSDPRGDQVAYLDYNPDTDLLEFKVANDDTHLYFYSRVAGKHGNTGVDPATGKRGRCYWYVYMDVDRNPGTGYIPTRDDDCYFGIDLGDDSEVQFEFVAGRFVKTFWGFTGAGGDEQVLSGRVRLGPSFYAREDEQGRPRDRYKVEYVSRGGQLYLTADEVEGTSADVVMAISPDGSEVEVAAYLPGFLQDQDNKPIMSLGQTINCAVGCESTTELRGGGAWSADSSPVMYGYRLR